MKPVRVVFLLPLVFLFAKLDFTAAQVLQLSPVAAYPAITHKFSSNGQAVDTQTFIFSNQVVQLRDFRSIQVTVSAPPDQAWLLTPPSKALSQDHPPELRFYLTYLVPGQAIGAPFVQNSAQLSFNSVNSETTSLSTSNTSNFISGGGGFEIGGAVSVKENVAFTNFSLTVEFDNTLLATAPDNAVLSSSLVFSYFLPLSLDPGPQLTLLSVPAPIELLSQTIAFPDGRNVLVLEWANSASFSLQAAPTVSGVYTNIPGATSPYSVYADGSQTFFRLRRNY